MRISDWSSDVCSSGLALSAGDAAGNCPVRNRGGRGGRRDRASPRAQSRGRPAGPVAGSIRAVLARNQAGFERRGQSYHGGVALRSEAHTSELQSLMRISYAVFCLKKKKKNTR